MALVVKVDEFSETISKYLAQYSANAKVVLDETIREVSLETKKKVKSGAPVRTGNYRKSWSIKQDTGRLTSAAVVYAKAPHYRLTHLLENGHAKRGGGRVAPKVHITPANNWAQEEAVDRFVRKMESS